MEGGGFKIEWKISMNLFIFIVELYKLIIILFIKFDFYMLWIY